jgi:hypothetical protein
MGRHFQYAKYVFRHKWFVMLACFSRGLYWRGIVHDLSKFRPSEWFPYANFFYKPSGSKNTKKNEAGYYKPTDTENAALDYAWLLHQKRNKHHWQWWCLPEDNGGIKVLPMPRKYALEMYCDWIGAGRAQGVSDWYCPERWYEANKAKMKLHEDTVRMLQEWFAIDSAWRALDR